jgi:hypothetical protein
MSIQTNNVTYRKGFVILQNTFDEVRVLGDKHQVWFDYDKLMKYYNQLIKYWEEALDTYTNSPKPQIAEIYVSSTILRAENSQNNQHKMNNIEEQEKLQKFVEKYPQHNFPGLAYSD